MRWVCAFANANGGRLEIGRNDAGTVVGVADVAKLLEELPHAMRNLLGIIVAVSLRTSEGRDSLGIVVEAYPNPISYRGHYYVRSGTTLQELKGAALDRFLLWRLGSTWDGVPVPGVRPEELSAAELRRFRERAADGGRLDPADQAVSDTALLAKGNLTRTRPPPACGGRGHSGLAVSGRDRWPSVGGWSVKTPGRRRCILRPAAAPCPV